MLAIRMQRTGRKGYATYRVIVQEAHRQPTSGKVVANLGSYNPHTKESTLNKEKALVFLQNGAQPSDRVVRLLQAEKIELPKWVKVTSDKKQKQIKNTQKLRRNQPEEAVVAEVEEAAPEAPVEAETQVEAAEPAVAEAEVVADDKDSIAETETEAEVEEPAAEVAEEPAAQEEVAEVESEVEASDKDSKETKEKA